MPKTLTKLILITLFFGLISNSAYAAPKAGAKCGKAGLTETYKNYKYSCIKKNGKLIWVKGSQVKNNNSANSGGNTSTTFSTNPAIDPSFKFLGGLYGYDPDAPAEWTAYQNFLVANRYHAGPLRYVLKELGTAKPKFLESFNGSTLPISQCQPKQVHQYPVLGFVAPDDKDKFYFNRHPSPNTVFQVLPVQWKEFLGKKTPAEDYKKYFDFLTSWIKNNSVNGSSVQMKIPDRYFTLPKGINSYSGIDTHGKPNAEGAKFFQDAIDAADDFVDFKGVNITLLVVPPETPIRYLGNQPWSSGPISDEGRVNSILTNPPHNFTEWHANQQLAIPGAWIHEIWHAGLDLGDHSGIDAMGNWGVMASMTMDLMGWEKYVAGFLSDEQVICVSANSTTTNWLVPSSYKGTQPKLIVIPLSDTRVIVVESMRSAGYNYKLQPQSQGALVYIIDTSKTGYHQGEYVVVPKGRTDPDYMDAPLKQGESLEVEGVRISVIEAGIFGEVIRVAKI